MIIQKKMDRPDMDLEVIRNEIVFMLHNHIKKPVVMLEQAEEKPKYPFLSYNFTVPYNLNNQRGIEETRLISTRKRKFEYDVEETIYLHPEFTLSINAYSLEQIESYNLAQKAMEWFKFVGRYDLDRLNVTVVSLEAFGNRNTLIADDYERRVGFDVILRTSDRIKRVIETIEEINIDKEYI